MSIPPDTALAVAPDLRPDLCRGYRPSAQVHDELCTPSGKVRPHWQRVARQLDQLCRGESGRQTFVEVQRLLQDNGVTYSLYDDPREAQRPWVLDPVPLLIDGPDWARVEAGLAQRARLLDRLLADLYGPATVLSAGLLPPELVFAHPGFLRPVHGGESSERPWLVFHGADLVRLPDGRFRVLNDRTQSPAGAGYALENRILMARALPNLYREAPLRRLAGFLEALRTTLSNMALHNREDPRVVVLTQGPNSRAYFEHAYLANYLSLSLVEGADLTVRDGRVWLKTLGGLKPVDVILRRVDDDLCDPLELRGDSLAGVPGLLQAVRDGGVALANPLGVALVENPALGAYLPALCQYLLGEELLLENVQTWWCGEADQRDYVLTHLNELVITTIEPQGPTRYGARLDKGERAELVARIQARPHFYVAQRPLEPSTAPVLEGEGDDWQPRPMVIRGFTVATVEGGYRVMPGGLARVCKDPDGVRVAVREGGTSKDCWVLAPAPEKHISLLRQSSGPVVVTRDGLDLPSRVADNLFWLGRYGERLDGTSRLARETLLRLLEQEREDSDESPLDDLLVLLELPPVPEGVTSLERFLVIRDALLNLLTDAKTPGSLQSIFAGMLGTGRAVRGHLGDDSWRVLNQLREGMGRLPKLTDSNLTRERLESNLTLLAAFFGLCSETMPHHQGWRFLDIGRYLERVQNTLALLRLAFVTARHSGLALWEVVMTVTDNLSAYRRRYRSELHPLAIVDLLLFDEDNPRSVGYQIKRIQRQLDLVNRPKRTPYRSAEQRLVLQASSTLALADLDALAALGREEEAGIQLARLLDALDEPLAALSEALVHSHFSHAEAPRQLLEMR